MEFSSKNTGMVAIHFSRGSSHPRDWTWLASRFFTIWAMREPLAFTWPQREAAPTPTPDLKCNQWLPFHSARAAAVVNLVSLTSHALMNTYNPSPTIFIKRTFIWILLQILTLEPPWKLCYWEEVETLKKTLFFCVLCILRTSLLCWFTWLLT